MEDARQRVVPVLEQIRNLNRGAGARAHGGLLETSAVHSEGEYELILKRAAKMKGKPSRTRSTRHRSPWGQRGQEMQKMGNIFVSLRSECGVFGSQFTTI